MTKTKTKHVDVAANDKNPIRFLSVCSGIEAASVAFGPLGWKAIGFSEIEKHPSAVLKHHYPDVPNYGDFTKINVNDLGRVDILCGGTPCQAFSVAGLRNSLDDARGNLSLEFVRLSHELADNNGLRNVIWENVPGVLSTSDNAFGCFLGGLVGSDDPVLPPAGRSWPDKGMVIGPKGRAAWRCLDAQYFGLAQRRRRVIVVADFGNGADPASVLFERASLQGNSAPSRETRKEVAGTIGARTGRSVGSQDAANGHMIPNVSHPLLAKSNSSHDDTKETYVDGSVYEDGIPSLARCDTTREGQSQDYETTTIVAVTGTLTATYGEQSGQDMMADGMLVPSVAHVAELAPTLGKDSYSPSKSSSGQMADFAIAFTSKDYGADAMNELSPTLRAGGYNNSHANGGVMPAIAQTVAIRGRDGGSTAELGGDIATSLRASQGGGDKPHVLIEPIAFESNMSQHVPTTNGLHPTLTRGTHASVNHKSTVRRLTPVECERLQGFPDNYTNIPWRGKPTSPDGPRYKEIGNSWAVPKFTWLAQRIQRFMPVLDAKSVSTRAANDN